MPASADCHFARGRTHAVCEDYAIARMAFAAVSDGCSSSANTDWGARFIARAASMQYAEARQLTEEAELSGTGIAIRAYHMRMACGLHGTALDATLLAAYRTDDVVEVRAWGDGIIAARLRETGEWEYNIIEYLHNAPAYLSYLLDSDRMGEYLSQTGAKRTVSTHLPDGLVSSDEHEGFPHNGDGFTFETRHYDVVALLSDGAQTFQRTVGRSPVHVTTAQALEHLLDIRGTVGEFVTRPVKAFLTKHNPKEGWYHTDDLAVAALYTGEAP